ncbi:MAG: GldG family protein, partial [Leptospiraceae bacterium]|nr:GldG family protein [Leptospiraceae bacterium]
MINFLDKFNSNRKFILSNLLILFILFNFLISDWNCRRDLSKNNRFNLTESTSKVINSLEEKLFIDAFYSVDVPGMHQARLNLAKEVLKEIAGVNTKKVDLRFYDPDSSDSVRKKAAEAGIRSFPLEKLERGSREEKLAFFGLKLTLGTKTEVIPIAYAAENIEYQILTTLKKMTKKGNSSGLAIIKAPGASTFPDPQMGGGSKDTFGIVIHKAYSPENGEPGEVNINEEPVTEEFTTLLWVGAPELTDKGKYHIDQFLMRGGNLVIFSKTMDFTLPNARRQQMMGGGGNEGIATPILAATSLAEFTEKYGFKVQSDLILEPESSMVTSSFVQVKPGVFAPYHYPLWPIASKDNKNLSSTNLLTSNSSALLLPWVSSIETFPDKQPEAKIEPVVLSTRKADKKTDFIMIGEEQIANVEMNPLGQNLPLGIHIKGRLKSSFTKDTIPNDVDGNNFKEKSPEGKEIQIFVLGTPYLVSDFLISDQYFEVFQKTNLPFFMNLLD